MLQAPLPPCDEFEALDAHLEDLEEPGSNLLQGPTPCLARLQPLGTGTDYNACVDVFSLAAFIVQPPQQKANDTPLSNSNGYTSEESDYSVVTPTSDDQMYQDMSFLQSMETSELVDVVADFSTDDLTRLTPEQQHQQQQKFAGKMIKGKVSSSRWMAFMFHGPLIDSAACYCRRPSIAA